MPCARPCTLRQQSHSDAVQTVQSAVSSCLLEQLQQLWHCLLDYWLQQACLNIAFEQQ
jgi:hypothetical protein